MTTPKLTDEDRKVIQALLDEILDSIAADILALQDSIALDYPHNESDESESDNV